jgi:hypothetical protein
MIAIFFTGTQLPRLACFPQDQKCNRKSFTNEIVESINQECNPGAGYRITKMMKIHMDQCRAHNAAGT